MRQVYIGSPLNQPIKENNSTTKVSLALGTGTLISELIRRLLREKFPQISDRYANGGPGGQSTRRTVFYREYTYQNAQTANLQ